MKRWPRPSKRATPAKPMTLSDIVTFAREILRFDPDEKQSEVLRAKAKRGLLCCTRQWGKSTVAAILALHHLLVEPKAFVVVISPSEKQSAELVRKVKGFLRQMGTKVKGDGHVRHSVLLPTGARMIALPATEDTNRCFGGVTLMLVDEAGHVPDSVYDAVRPFLATTDGALWLLSTPNGKRGFFWKAWSAESKRWTRFTVRAKDCPRIPKDFLNEERETRGERRYRQEYECEFLDAAGSVFDVSLILTRVTKDFLPLE
ncbi:MAG: terminase family protein [Bryobacteraceae bacterium]